MGARASRCGVGLVGLSVGGCVHGTFLLLLLCRVGVSIGNDQGIDYRVVLRSHPNAKDFVGTAVPLQVSQPAVRRRCNVNGSDSLSLAPSQVKATRRGKSIVAPNSVDLNIYCSTTAASLTPNPWANVAKNYRFECASYVPPTHRCAFRRCSARCRRPCLEVCVSVVVSE